MREKVIQYFSTRHLLINFMFIGIFVLGIFFWTRTSKEELPDISFDHVHVNVTYPGASPSEVEHFVIKPLEEVLTGIDGIEQIRSNASVGRASLSVDFEKDYTDPEEILTEIRNAVLDVKLPDDIIDDPVVRMFKTTKKAIVDIAVYREDVHLLDFKTRQELQEYVLALENQLLKQSEINSVSRTGYLREEIQIKVKPEKLMEYNLPFNDLNHEIKNNHIRQPAGSIENRQEPKVTLSAELDSIDKLKQLVVRGGFEGNSVRLSQVAEVGTGFEKNQTIHKINGHEGIVIRAVKSSSYGILEAMDAVNQTVVSFRKNSLKNTPVKVLLLDDESRDVRNRLSLIGINGTIGFVLIIIILLIFLDLKSSIWVALGIPFTFCFTMVFVYFMGYTINNITLAAVILVMGIVVDDAIVVAENVARFKSQGMPPTTAVVKGTSYVFLPIVASILTTCAAFLPIFNFSGRMAQMIKFMPPIVFLMLGASLLESLFILPAHLNTSMPRWLKVVLSLGTLPWFEKKDFQKKHQNKRKTKNDDYEARHWFFKIEDIYGKFLIKAMNKKGLVFALFLLILVLAGWIYQTQMKFVMFPREETTEVFITGKTPPGTNRFDTARLARNLEKIVDPYIGQEVIGYRSSVARSRRGRAVEENSFRLRIEIVPKEKRKKSAKQLIAEWEPQMRAQPDIKELRIIRSHFGQESGSSIEVMVQENNESKRQQVAERIAAALAKHPSLKGVEIDQPMMNPEYKIKLDREKIKRLGINPANIGSTLRSLLEGRVLYELTSGDEEIYVRLTAVDAAKDHIAKVLQVPIENERNYLVPLNDIVQVEETLAANAIEREDLKRTSKIFADMKEDSELTPLEIAKHFEDSLFPEIMSAFPSTVVSFIGEIKDTRESKGDFLFGIIMVVLLIYAILVLLFNSLLKPLIIMLALPFGAVGIILAFWAHGMTVYGFMATIGTLGLAGVVVNDAIIMLVKLDKEYDRCKHKELSNQQITDIAKTRLRAVLLTTLTTVAGIFPTAYGFAGYDAMLAEMMLALAWGLIFGTLITLLLVPSMYGLMRDIRYKVG